MRNTSNDQLLPPPRRARPTKDPTPIMHPTITRAVPVPVPKVMNAQPTPNIRRERPNTPNTQRAQRRARHIRPTLAEHRHLKAQCPALLRELPVLHIRVTVIVRMTTLRGRR